MARTRTRYFALLGDLVSSRSPVIRAWRSRAPAHRPVTRTPDPTTQRRKQGKLIESTLKQLNREYSSDWHAPIMTTRGIDEISGVLRDPQHAFSIAVRLDEAIWPNRFRFALASGTIDVAERSRDAASMDGPVFHLASSALRRASEEGLMWALEIPEVGPEACGLAESTARLYGILVWHLTPARLRVMSAFRKYRSQTLTAESLGISQQSVSEAIRAGHVPELFAVEEAMRVWLRAISLAKKRS